MNESKSGDSSLRDWFGKSRSSDGKPGWVQLGGKYAGKPCARQPGQKTKPKCGSSKMKRNLNKKEEDAAFRRKQRQDPNPDRKGKAINVKTEEVVLEKKGEKDACYHKVKSRYSVWPSAYASGALVKCRKVGAANWGNKTKKESFEPEAKEGITFQQFQEKCWKGYEKKGMKTMFGKRYPNCVKKKKTRKEEVEQVKEGDGDPCWDSHKQVGMKKKGNRMVPNCVPKNEEATCMGNKKGEECPIHGKKECPTLEEATRIPPRTGNIYLISFSWRGKYMNMKLFFPEVRNPTRSEIQDALDKFYPGCNLLRFDKTVFQPSDSVLNVGVSEEVEELEEKSAAWQRKEGKNKSGGLNEKGRKSYERENPGSDLKAPSKEKGNKRRASFCARMKGMKKKLTSAKTANDPDSRINKSLRAWNC